MSSERDPRPSYHRFQQLMDRMDTASIGWWADSIEACRAALLESRSVRLDINPDGTTRSAEERSEFALRQESLARLAARLRQLREQNRLPGAARSARAWLTLLKTTHSERVSSHFAITAAEREALTAELPNAIARGLSESLDRETVVLRYDMPSRCAYCIKREGPGLSLWVWSDLGAEAAGDLLSSIAAIDEPMTETLALELARRSQK